MNILFDNKFLKYILLDFNISLIKQKINKLVLLEISYLFYLLVLNIITENNYSYLIHL